MFTKYGDGKIINIVQGEDVSSDTNLDELKKEYDKKSKKAKGKLDNSK